MSHQMPAQPQRPPRRRGSAHDLRRTRRHRAHIRRKGRSNRATKPQLKRLLSVLVFFGFCLILIFCDVSVIRYLAPTAPSFVALAGLVDFGFYLLGVIAALIFIHESFDGWWREIDCWQGFAAPVFFGIGWATAHALHAPLTGLTAIGLFYGIGFLTNPKVFRRLKDVLKFLVALKNGKEKD